MEDNNNNNAPSEPAPAIKKEKSRSSIMNLLKPKSKDKSPREGNESDSNIVSPVVGTTSAIQVNTELEDQVTATENFSERLKVIAKDFAKMEKAVKHAFENEEKFEPVVNDICTTSKEELKNFLLAGCLFKLSEFHKLLQEIRQDMQNAIPIKVEEPLRSILNNEVKDAKSEKSRHEKAKSRLESATSELNSVRNNKKAKEKQLKEAELGLQEAQANFDKVDVDAVEAIKYYNAVADYKALEALVEYLELQRKFYSFGAKFLNEILPSLYEFKRHANEARDKRESVRLMRERQSLQPGAQVRGIKVFGVPLTQVCLQDNLPYPLLVEQAVQYLEQHGMEEEGIFRRSPTLPDLMTLRANCEEGNMDFNHVTDPHLVSALLKMFLRELPEPVIPTALYDAVVAVNNVANEQTKIEQLQKVVGQLPLPNRLVLHRVMLLLVKVTENVAHNKMSAVALSTVIAPNILYPKTVDLSTADPFEPRTAINFVIQYAPQIFEPYTADLDLALAAMKHAHLANAAPVSVTQPSEPNSVSTAQPGSTAPLSVAPQSQSQQVHAEPGSSAPGSMVAPSSSPQASRPSLGSAGSSSGNVFEHRATRTSTAPPRPPTEKKPRALPQLKRGEGAHGSNNNNLTVRAEPESVSHSEHSHEERQPSPQRGSVSSSRSSFDNSGEAQGTGSIPAPRPRPAQNFQNIFAASNTAAHEVKTSPHAEEHPVHETTPSIVVEVHGEVHVETPVSHVAVEPEVTPEHDSTVHVEVTPVNEQ